MTNGSFGLVWFALVFVLFVSDCAATALTLQVSKVSTNLDSTNIHASGDTDTVISTARLCTDLFCN